MLRVISREITRINASRDNKEEKKFTSRDNKEAIRQVEIEVEPLEMEYQIEIPK